MENLHVKFFLKKIKELYVQVLVDKELLFSSFPTHQFRYASEEQREVLNR